MQQTRLAGAGRAGDRDPVAGLDFAGAAVHRDDRLVAGAEGPGHLGTSHQCHSTILPLDSVITRSAIFVTAALWVTTRTPWPASARPRMRSRTSSSVWP